MGAWQALDVMVGWWYFGRFGVCPSGGLEGGSVE